MDFIKQLLNSLNELSSSAPFVGGVVAVAVTGLMGFVFFKMPKHSWAFLSTMFTVRFAVNNGGWGKNQQVFENVLRWFSKYEGKKLTRTYSYEGTEYSSGTMGPGNGNHYIIYKGIPLKVSVADLESSGSERIKKVVSITTLFIFRKWFFNIVREVTSSVENDEEPMIRSYSDGYWSKVRPIAERRLETIIVADNRIEEIKKLIDTFLVSRSWYKERGIPYKLTILLYGPPGTGKTSLIKALAHHYKYHIAPVAIHACSDDGFVKMVNALPPKTFMVLEDIDTCGAVSTRKAKERSTSASSDTAIEPKDAPGGEVISLDISLNLSTILNTFDGVAELDGQIIFKTTNHPEKLDAAIYRPGRVDKCIPIDYLDLASIARYIEMVYPGHVYDLLDSNIRIPGSKLQELFMENRGDAANFVYEVNEILAGIKPAVEFLEAV